MSSIFVRMKILVAALLICVMWAGLCLPGLATGQEADSSDDLMPCLGGSVSELAKALGGFQSIGYPQFSSANSDGVIARISAEMGTITGWPADTTYQIFLMAPDYSLDGYRVGDSFADAKARALQEGWELVGEENDDYEIVCVFSKSIDAVDYTLDLNSDYSKSTIEYITMDAINSREMENAIQQVEALEAANPNAFGSYNNGFTFRNGITWDSTAEEIMGLESEQGQLYDEDMYKEVYYPEASGLWYMPGLTYYFFWSDTVNYIKYDYFFGIHSAEGDEIPYVVNLMNEAYGPADTPDQEKFELLEPMLPADDIEILHGTWNLDDGTMIILAEDGRGDLSILYFAEEFFPLMRDYMAANPEM